MRTVAFLLILAHSVALLAQGGKGSLNVGVETMAALPLIESDGVAKELGAYATYALSQRLECGVSAGVALYARTLLPVKATARWKLRKGGTLIPFVRADVGGACALSSQACGGFAMAAGVGLEKRLRRGSRLTFTVGLRHQEFRSLKSFENSAIRTQYTEHISHNAVALSAAFSVPLSVLR